MYPRKVYISTQGDRYKFTPVIITGYTDMISVQAFDKAMRDAGYKMRNRYGSNTPYQFVMSVEYHLCDMSNFAEINREPITLMDFYKKIGWDYKNKKLKGKTLKRHIIDCMEGYNK